VELGGWHDRVRHRSLGDQAFLLALARVVVVSVNRVDTDDRQKHVVAHPGTLLGGQKVACRGAEVRNRLPAIGNRGIGGVDDRVDTDDRRVQAITRGQVDTE
jgi:hypothetical protein